MLFAPSDRMAITVAVDNTRQRPEGYALRWLRALRQRCGARTANTLQIAADLGYAPPSFNAFDRLTDTDTPWRSNQDLGGAVTHH